MGAQILLVPSAFTVPTGQAHWHTLLRGTWNQPLDRLIFPHWHHLTTILHFCVGCRTARAIENQCYVIAAAQYGRHNEKRESYGHSLVVDPWGVIVADAGGVDKECKPAPTIVTCDVDLDMVASVRERMPVQEHRCPIQSTT